MCYHCGIERCLDSERICGCNPRKEQRIVEGYSISYDSKGNPIYSRNAPRVLVERKVVKKISCEYCGAGANRKKGTRTVDFIFTKGIHLCVSCYSKPRCAYCDGELSNLGCMVCRKVDGVSISEAGKFGAKESKKLKDVLEVG